MGMAFLHGQNGGGNLLRLKVVGSASAPSNPKDNTIWIKTSVPILENQVFFNEQISDDFWKGAGNGSVYIPFQASNSSYKASTGANIVVPKGNLVEFNVNFLGCKQLINDEWVNMDAYIYHGSSWIQFSSVFSATINVTYPAGSTCTATCGSTTLRAPDTSGTWACVVPNAGTWTITATYGANTKSEAVSITTAGQIESRTLSYRYYLYNYLDGQTAYDGITGGWNRYTTKDGCISLYNDANMDNPTRCNSKIDFLGYKTLCAELICWNNTSSASGTAFAIGTQTDTTIHSWGAIRGDLCGKADTDWTVKTIDVSSITEPVFFSFRGYYSYSAIRAMWLE